MQHRRGRSFRGQGLRTRLLCALGWGVLLMAGSGLAQELVIGSSAAPGEELGKAEVVAVASARDRLTATRSPDGGGRPAPWAVENPGGAGARLGLGLGYLVERQDGLRFTFSQTIVTLHDLAQGTDSTTVLQGDPELNNRKFDYQGELSLPTVRIPIALPTERWGFYSAAILEAAWADLTFEFVDQAQPELSTALEGDGLAFGLGLELAAPFCRTCRWFAGGGYRFRTLSRLEVERAPLFNMPNFEVLSDEVTASRETHELFARLGYGSFGDRVAPYFGIRGRWTEVEVKDELRLASAIFGQETTLSSRSEYESDTLSGVVGVDVHFAGSFFGRAEASFSNDDRAAFFKITYVFPRQRTGAP